MTIVPIPLKNSSSVREFFREGGSVEVPRPQQCFYELCQLKKPLRKNGSYSRQVIYWGLLFLVQICRFRCRRCGRTASCPFGWLVPYRRFSAEVVCAGIEAYASSEVTYKDLSLDLSDLELAKPEADVRGEPYYAKQAQEHAEMQPGAGEQPVCRPAKTTVFYWVDFISKRVDQLLVQIQKESVQEKKRGRALVRLPAESTIENPNGYKAATNEKRRMLDLLAFATQAALSWLGDGQSIWYKLRAYFLSQAESRKDSLTDVLLELSITHTLEFVIF